MPDFAIEKLDATQAEKYLPGLVKLFQDAVESGASLGYWNPLTDKDAGSYWQGVLKQIPEGYKILLAACQGQEILGSVQLELSPKQNGSHRAEVQKLMVHRSARGKGIGRALMAAAEQAAREAGRRLLVLDTKTGDEAEKLYPKWGYIQAGVIPQYVVEEDGSYHSTTLFYRLLDA